MKRLFISQPMRNKTDEQITREREQAISIVKERFPQESISVVDSYFGNDGLKMNPIEALGRSIIKMADADVVVFCNGWTDARGCKIEHQVAENYGLKIYVL